MPIVLPLVGDLYKDDDEKTSSVLGIIETSNTFGKVLAPILGSVFAAFLIACLIAMSVSIIFVGFTSKKLILLLVVTSIVGIAIEHYCLHLMQLLQKT